MRCRNCGRELTLANKSNSYGLCKACKREEDNCSFDTSYDDCDCGCHSIFNDNNDDCDCGCND